MVGGVWACEKSEISTVQDYNKKHDKDICRQMLVERAEAYGANTLIEMAGGRTGDPGECERIRHYFECALGVKSLQSVSVDRMLALIEPKPLLERMVHRKAANINYNRDFTKVATHGAPMEDDFEKEDNPIIGFKSC